VSLWQKKGGTMKTKNFSKKLTLNKKTIASLKGKDMQGVNGGATDPSNNPYVCCIPKTFMPPLCPFT
jgi:hypothetical protein